jgi:hypothetical protein
MRTGLKLAGWVLICVLCTGVMGASAATSHKQRKAKKPELQPLPFGPQGPVLPIPLDAMKAVPPQVSYQGGQLTIVALNSTLSDILRAVRQQTTAEMEIPAGATERVVTHLGPGPAREVVAQLLNGSRFNYVLLGSPSDANLLTRIVLVAKTGPDIPAGSAQSQQPGANQAPIMAAPSQEVAAANPEPAEPDAAEENADENAEENTADNADATQPGGATPDQQMVKTPQQMLQEMQQRQLQLQQQQPGQLPAVYPQVMPVPPRPGQQPDQQPQPQ